MTNSHFKISKGKGVILLAFIVFLAVYLFGDPYSHTWWLKCPLHALTGWQCPFCGLQRQLHALLHFHLCEAWRLNPVLLLCYPYLLLLLVSSIFPNTLHSSSLPRRLRRFLAVCISDRAIFVFLTVLLLWGVARNL